MIPDGNSLKTNAFIAYIDAVAALCRPDNAKLCRNVREQIDDLSHCPRRPIGHR
jgi:hypothetical protein